MKAVFGTIQSIGFLLKFIFFIDFYLMFYYVLKKRFFYSFERNLLMQLHLASLKC